MFEENLQFKTPSFGMAGRHTPHLNPKLSDVRPSAAIPSVKAAAPVDVAKIAKSEPHTPVLPDFLLNPGTVKASSLSETKVWTVRKPFRYLFIAACALVVATAGLQIFLDRQFAQAASMYPPTDNKVNVSPALLNSQPNTSAASDYAAASTLPTHVDIEALNIHAKVTSADFTENGNLTKSINASDTAWNNDSSQPGKQGTMIIGSNTYSCEQSSVFNNLKDIALGTDVLVTNGAGVVVNYKVIRKQVYDQAKVNLETLSDPPVHYRPGLNIVTCAGGSETNQRLVVNAVLYQ
jgi:sortase (surface protein transpeptidase)